MKDHYKKILEFNPKVLQAYPTPLYIFSDYLERNRLKVCIDYINVTAEYLYEYQRNKIESVFGIKIFNWYGARELGHIATECSEHLGMHINIGGLYVEVIKNNKAVYDELGDLVVTDLWNKAMPLIRYRIGDIGMISRRKCRCGSHLPLLEEVAGRYVDTFKKRDGTYIPGIAFTNRIINECKGIEELQIVQIDYEKFVLKIVKGKVYTKRDLEGLQKRMNDYFHQNLLFKVEFVDRIPIEKSGKIRFCKSLIS